MLKVGTICSGIGFPELALKRLGLDYQVEYFCEIDKFAIESYCQLHNENKDKNLGDLTKIDLNKVPYVDLLIAGTPCQDFSLAGQGRGGQQGSGTRSSLMWNFLDIVRLTKPKYVIWENVKNAIGEKNKSNFDKFLNEFTSYGYTCSYSVLNATDYEIPQNRERVFMVARFDRKGFNFPPSLPLKLRLKDLLESEVDEKYYLKESNLQKILFKPKSYECKINPNVANCLTTNYGNRESNESYVGVVADLNNTSHEQSNRVYGTNGVSPTLDTFTGGGREPKIMVLGSYNPNSQSGGQMIIENLENLQNYDFEVKTIDNKAYIIVKGVYYRVRKLTTRECWRLMGASDDDFNKIKNVSNSQLYKQAGNGMVVNKVMAVLRRLLLEDKLEVLESDKGQLQLAI